MSARLPKKLETITNIAIILVAVIIGVVFVKNYLLGSKDNSREENLVGTKVSVPDVNWAKNGQTLLLILQKGCHFCAESAPFYQRLIQETSGRQGFQIIAVLPQEVEEGRKYLSELNVPVSEVKQTRPGTLGVKGTPTLLLVDNTGVVTDAWLGKLPPEKESAVLDRLRAARASN
jgi:thioredoxin-related protein